MNVQSKPKKSGECSACIEHIQGARREKNIREEEEQNNKEDEGYDDYDENQDDRVMMARKKKEDHLWNLKGIKIQEEQKQSILVTTY